MTSINLENTDPKFKYELAKHPGAENFMRCFSCFSCVNGCPVSEVTAKFSPLRLMRTALLGLKEEVLKNENLWLCSSCYACQESCPMAVRVTDILTLLKNMAIMEGHVPMGIRVQMDLIKGNGRIYPLDDFDNKKRAKAGLPAIPTTCEVVKHLFPEE